MTKDINKMSNYKKDIEAAALLRKKNGSGWDAIIPESVARMRAQIDLRLD